MHSMIWKKYLSIGPSLEGHQLFVSFFNVAQFRLLPLVVASQLNY